jgi:hypothetical protein
MTARQHPNIRTRQHANLRTLEHTHVGDTPPYRRTTGDAPDDPPPLILRCPRCGATVGVQPAATAWCLPCAHRMHPIRPKGTP